MFPQLFEERGIFLFIADDVLLALIVFGVIVFLGFRSFGRDSGGILKLFALALVIALFLPGLDQIALGVIGFISGVLLFLASIAIVALLVLFVPAFSVLASDLVTLIAMVFLVFLVLSQLFRVTISSTTLLLMIVGLFSLSFLGII